MKKLLSLAIVCVCSMTMQAQLNLGNLVNKVTGSNTVGNVVSGIVDNLLGTADVSPNTLVGTWTYSGPCLALESENVLANMGGSVVAGPVEKKLATVLESVGVKPGQVVMTFKEDGTMTAQVGKLPAVPLTWTVEGNTLTLTNPLVQAVTIPCNVKVTTSGMQISFESKKLMNVLNTLVGSVGKANASIGAVSNLLGNYKGVQVGMKFTK